MRVFIGIALPDTWREMLACVAAQVRADRPAWHDARWVPAPDLHITLAFLGEIAPGAIDPLVTALRSDLETCTPFDLSVRELVVPMPRESRARMLWTTLADPEGECARVAERVSRTTAVYGTPPEERAFTPHITLARARPPRRYQRLTRGRLEPCVAEKTIGAAPMSVRAVTVYSSTLTAHGAHYEVLAEVPLGGR